PHLILSGMDASVVRSGWYTSDVIIHTATFDDPDILAPAADIQVTYEGRNEVPIPDGLGGTATQFVNIDKSAPVVSMNDLYTRGDGVTVLSVTVTDVVSGPDGVEISLDHGQTWQPHVLPNGFSAPDVTWNLEIQPDHPENILARGVDVAGNVSAVATLVGQGKQAYPRMPLICIPIITRHKGLYPISLCVTVIESTLGHKPRGVSTNTKR
ncbi:MAG: hypothetical protein WCK35_25975, partial [Chloroflexota bacterium]